VQVTESDDWRGTRGKSLRLKYDAHFTVVDMRYVAARDDDPAVGVQAQAADVLAPLNNGLEAAVGTESKYATPIDVTEVQRSVRIYSRPVKRLKSGSYEFRRVLPPVTYLHGWSSPCNGSLLSSPAAMITCYPARL
jgi:hypothetical protein